MKEAFAAGVRARGERYWQEGRVSLAPDPGAALKRGDAVVAAVDGTFRYTTMVVPDGAILRVCCTCPYFEEREQFCKHIWATLLALDQAEPSAMARCRVPAPLEVSDELEEFDEFEEHDAPHTEPVPIWHRVIAEAFQDGGRHVFEQNRAVALDPRPGTDARFEELEYLLVAERHGGGWRPVVHARRRVPAPPSMITDAGTEYLLRPVLAHGAPLPALQDPGDRRVVAILSAADRALRPYVPKVTWGSSGDWSYDGWRIGPDLMPEALEALSRTGRCARWVPEDDLSMPRPPQPDATDVDGRLERLEWHDGDPLELRLGLGRDRDGDGWELFGYFAGHVDGRDVKLRITPDYVLFHGGVLMFGGHAVRVRQTRGLAAWVDALRDTGAGLPVSAAEVDGLVATIVGMSGAPALDLPEELSWQKVSVPVTPQLRLAAELREKVPAGNVPAGVRFAYDEWPVDPRDPRDHVVDLSGRRILARDLASEDALLLRLKELGFRPYVPGSRHEAAVPGLGGWFPSADLAQAVRCLLGEGWYVAAEDLPVRHASGIQVSVTSGINWFDVEGKAHFSSGTAAQLDAVLDTVLSGGCWVPLDDGSLGMLPETWLRRWRVLAGLGTTGKGGLRIARAQAAMADAVLADAGADAAGDNADGDGGGGDGGVVVPVDVEVDAGFEQTVERIRSFDGIRPRPEPRGFKGTLRDYQQLALGWARFLEDLGLGGCLADDMGLGKTVQVLAMLLSRKHRLGRRRSRGDGDDQPRVSLVVVPRSLIFNWLHEAVRFAPSLRVVDHSRPDRPRDPRGWISNCDVVLTTYGVLRQDIDWLAEVEFDYCVLDEAQAIKNPQSKTARAARRLRARQRMALSGTPVENNLVELWSLFEFLNPGMLGSQQHFKRWIGGGSAPGEQHEALARMVRPFVLRRTKREVAPELPPREDHELTCPLGPRQRAIYDRLRRHFQGLVMSSVGEKGIAKSGMVILEALLRLRQAACHVGLTDASLRKVPSAKLELLLDRLTQVLREGHKALVFSQFVRLLSFVREPLDADGVSYAYLDGRTRDRQKEVDRFQSDPGCPLFLISLKAGGLGLNLTAAEYVFLLDPWWNPAVEAQAVDRTHRIGQEHPVFAYRLVAEDTIEQKILELQARKRELADAVIRSDKGFLSSLTKEDLFRLLS